MREDVAHLMCRYLDFMEHCRQLAQLRDEAATDDLIEMLGQTLAREAHAFLIKARQFIEDYPRFFKKDEHKTLWIGEVDVMREARGILQMLNK